MNVARKIKKLLDLEGGLVEKTWFISNFSIKKPKVCSVTVQQPTNLHAPYLKLVILHRCHSQKAIMHKSSSKNKKVIRR